MVVGLVIGWLPGPGGFLSIVGLAILAQEMPIVAKALDGCEVKIRRLGQSVMAWVQGSFPNRKPDGLK